MQGLILAAGRGSRLGSRGDGTCKCLLDVGRRPLIEHQIDALAGCGVGPVGMIVGYAAHEVEAVVGIRAEYVQNPRWSVTNSLYSFWLARDWIRGDVVILNCDVLFSPRIIERLLEVPGDALAYDSGSGERREEMSVHVVNGCLVDMSKTMPNDQVSGENVGALKLTHETVRALVAKAGELIAAGREKEWLGSAVRELAATHPIRAIDMNGLPWAEIDFPADLDRARKVVWPAIQREERRARPRWRLARWGAGVALAAVLAFTTYRACITPDETVWESTAVVGAERVSITDGERARTWWLLREGGEASVSVTGPTTMRVNTRPVFMTGPSDSAHFVLDVTLDGVTTSWHSAEQTPSRTWHTADWPVGKRDRLDINVPPGTHAVVARLAATDTGGCLLRFDALVDDP